MNGKKSPLGFSCEDLKQELWTFGSIRDSCTVPPVSNSHEHDNISYAVLKRVEVEF